MPAALNAAEAIVPYVAQMKSAVKAANSRAQYSRTWLLIEAPIRHRTCRKMIQATRPAKKALKALTAFMIRREVSSGRGPLEGAKFAEDSD